MKKLAKQITEKDDQCEGNTINAQIGNGLK